MTPGGRALAAGLAAALLLQLWSGAPWRAPAGQALAALGFAALYGLLLGAGRRRWPGLLARAVAVLLVLLSLVAIATGLAAGGGWRMAASAATALAFHGFVARVAHRLLRERSVRPAPPP